MTLRAMLADGGSLDEAEMYDEIGPPSYLASSPIDEENEEDAAVLDPAYDMVVARKAVSNLGRSTETTRKALMDARERLMASKYDRTSALLAIAQGLSQPTQMGGVAGFTQSLGNMAGALQGPVKEKREFERQKLQDALGIDTSLYGLDEKTAQSAIELAQIRARMTQLSKDPAAIAIHKYYENLPSDAKRVEFLETLRNPNITVKQREGVETVIDPRALTHPGVPGVVLQQPLTTLEKEAAAQRTIAEAKESGKTTGEKVATAQFDLPKVVSSANYLKDLLGRLRDHEGMPYSVGATSVLPVLPGTAAADFRSLLKQVGGKQFLAAYESLKSTGQITEIEGEKATDAIARMQAAQSEGAFIEAANEFMGIVDKAVNTARIQAQATPTSKLPRIKNNAEWAKLPPGDFIGPDGKRRTKGGGKP